jgi:hypothetical protein
MDKIANQGTEQSSASYFLSGLFTIGSRYGCFVESDKSSGSTRPAGNILIGLISLCCLRKNCKMGVVWRIHYSGFQRNLL